ncbi:MAG: glutamine--fructose-6-phosphate transaminase (isomerizing) [Nitrospinae bacterium]|nr:glutamine--fructose-6-phosphate transaminase (isomerizing) [Nitrospinota bacterium]
MSGIAGYIGHRNAKEIILDALARLEYRGYDSSGIAIISGGGVRLHRTLGRPAGLVEKLRGRPIAGNLGIGHTRWASHGKPSIRNAHPLVADTTAVAHNGIIDNAVALKESLVKKGARFKSETDTEILPHLINLHWKGTLLESVLAALKKVEGGLTFCAVSGRDPDQLVVVCKGNPMVIGLGEGEYLAASDATAIAPYTDRMVFLRDGEVALLSREGAQFMDFQGRPVEHTPQKIAWNPVMAEKRGYRHFLLKEIVESPRAARETIAACFPPKSERFLPEQFSFPCAGLEKVKKVIFSGSGSSYFAAMLGQWVCESVAGIPASRVIASEHHFAQRIIENNTLYVAASQSGETRDTLESARIALQKGARLFAVTNNASSTLARMAHDVFVTRSGPEISIASSKTFTTMVVAMVLLTLHLGRGRKTIPPEEQEKLLNALHALPGQMEQMVTYETTLRRLAEKFAHHRSFFFVGRGLQYPAALYAALMMKEVANIHAEGLVGGEIKHGPISLVEKDTPVMYLANQETPAHEILNDMDELRARGATLIATGASAFPEMRNHCDEHIAVPPAPDALAPLLAIVPAQLFIYYVALYNKKDVDRPRNVAKSVTV